MATEIIMPKAGMAMERGTIIQWLKKPGDRVEAGDPILEIETDKVSMEVEAETSGYILAVTHHEGEEVDVITTIGYIGEKGEVPPLAVDGLAPAGPAADGPAATAPESTEAHSRPRATPAARQLAREAHLDLASIRPGGKWGEVRRADVEKQHPRSTGSPRVSPLAKAAAEKSGIDPASVEGSGPGGRVLQQDILAVAKEPERAAPSRPLDSMRRKIAERMMESHRTIPPVTLNKKVDVTDLFALRKSLNRETSDSGEAVTLTPFLVRAAALALRDSPWMRTRLEGNMLTENPSVDIGIAVALAEGLLVPVLREADTLSLFEINSRTRELALRARERKLGIEELTGAAFSITNLGMYGISSFNPIINPPETAILGVNAAEDQLYLEEGMVRSRKVMTLSLTLDHRVIDGAQGAIFLQKLEGFLRNPVKLLL
ncbi:MAG: 2-oxo acid dehydrogenase subunit E2 [Spirochaetaceae bacterium]|nr:MAG: 2-oxo acid dehydrogenase subunit E2 [Spirochaetaceae bacterium]